MPEGKYQRVISEQKKLHYTIKKMSTIHLKNILSDENSAIHRAIKRFLELLLK